MTRIYFDHNATTPVAPEVAEAIATTTQTVFGNPSSVHGYGQQAKTVLDEARASVAQLLGAEPTEIVFTSGGSESDNLAIRGAADAAIANGRRHLVTSSIEHEAVLRTVKALSTQGWTTTLVGVDTSGVVSPERLANALRDDTALVSVMHANNEIGTIQDIKVIGDICKKHNAIFHSDTVQTMAHFPFDMRELNIDFMAASAHKFHGPKGVGFVYISEDIQIKPFLRGGGQERNMRAGTENIYGIAGLAMAMEMAYKHLEEETKYIKGLKCHLTMTPHLQPLKQ